MRLEEWRLANNISVKELAAELNLGVTYIYKYLNGTRKPRIELIKEIEILTNGQVTIDDWIADGDDKNENHAQGML